jgi:hypothetical protein
MRTLGAHAAAFPQEPAPVSRKARARSESTWTALVCGFSGGYVFESRPAMDAEGLLVARRETPEAAVSSN